MTASAAATQERLDKLLQQMKRQFLSSTARPPNAAAAAAGRELGYHLSSLLLLPLPAQKESFGNATAKKREQYQDRVLKFLCETDIHPSVPHAFFSAVLESYRDDERAAAAAGSTGTIMTATPMDWLPQWVVSVEEVVCSGDRRRSPVFETLSASIRAFACSLSVRIAATGTAPDRAEAQAQAIVDTFRRLQLPSSRMILFKETVQVAFEDVTNVRTVLSPLLACSILALSTAPAEKLAYLQHMWWATWMAFTSNDAGDCSDILHFMTDALNLHLWSIPCMAGAGTGADAEGPIAAVEMAQSWLVELLQLGQSLGNADGTMTAWLECAILRETFPRLAHQVHHHRLVLKSLLEALQGLVEGASTSSCGSGSTTGGTSARTAMDPVLVLRLVTMALSTPLVEDAHNLIVLINQKSPPSNRSAWSMLYALASINRHDPSCHQEAELLRSQVVSADKQWLAASTAAATKFASVTAKRKRRKKKQSPNADPSDEETTENNSNNNNRQLIELVDDEDSDSDSNSNSNSNNQLLDMIVETKDFSHTNFTAIQQLGALLLGVAMLDRCADDGRNGRPAFRDSRCFVKNLLARYPHLSVTLMPVLVDRINDRIEAADADRLLSDMEFLCETVPVDPHCAQEVWHWMQSMMHQPHVSLTIRVSLVRLLPRLCAANRRLYRRVAEAVGSFVGDRAPELRLAAAATLADLAADDAIRDVSDVIGWIQVFLTEDHTSPMEALLVHYAVLSLHHLLVARELDFDLVVKVLNKRLCSVGDASAVLELPMVVLEPLVLLLGDGETDDESDESDEEDGDRDPTTAAVSPQVTSAVRTLVAVGIFMAERSRETTNEDDPWMKAAVSRVLQNVLASLSQYSLVALGVEEDSIKDVVRSEGGDNETPALSDAAEHYVQLGRLVLHGIESRNPSSERGEGKDAATELAARLLEKEEEVMGAALWQKRGQRKQPKPNPAATTTTGGGNHGVRSVLPMPSEVKALAEKERDLSPAPAIAVLLSTGEKDVSLLFDNGDVCIENCADPLFLVFAVQGYLNTAARILSNDRVNVEQILSGIGGWFDIFVSPDAMYLALAAVSIHIPSGLRQNEASSSTYVQEVCDVVFGAFKNHHFQKQDVAKVGLGMIGVSTLRFGSLSRVDDIITMLEQSVRGYGGEQGFGAYYGLAMIGQALSVRGGSGQGAPVADIGGRISRVVGFLLEELFSCCEESVSAFISLVACVKSGVATKDLVATVSGLDAGSIALLVTKRTIARYLFLSCALCFPALATVHGDLLVAVLHLLNAFEWGSGKGLALPSVLRACKDSGALPAQKVEEVASAYTVLFSDKTGSGDEASVDAEGLEDIFYAVCATSSASIPRNIRRLLVGNTGLFDDDGCALTLMASVVSVSSLPCLGATSFGRQVELRPVPTLRDVQDVVQVVTEAVQRDDNSKYSRFGMVMMGLLASLKYPMEKTSPASKVPEEEEEEVSVGSQASRADFSKLPAPQAGTLLDGVMEIIEGFVLGENQSVERDIVLPRAIGSLERLSLPGQYGRHFLNPLIYAENPVMKDAYVSLLSSQIRGRRRAVFDGREYVNLSLRISTAPVASWYDLLGRGGAPRLFVASLPYFVVKLPPDSVEGALENIWRSCLAGQSFREELVQTFLSSIKDLLQNSGLSPKLLSFIRRFVAGQAFAYLQKLPLETLVTKPSAALMSIFDVYVLCLKEVPSSFLGDLNFFKLQESMSDGFSSDVIRVLSSLELLRLGYFESKMAFNELSGILQWLIRELPRWREQTAGNSLRRVACSFAVASANALSGTKRDCLAGLLEGLLLTKSAGSRIGLEWLSVVMASWNDGQGSDGDLSLGYLCTVNLRAAIMLPPAALQQFCLTMLRDLPFNLAAFCRREKLTAVVSNQLHRLYTHWSDHAVDRKTLESLRHAILSCRSSQTREEGFIKLASSLLQEGL